MRAALRSAALLAILAAALASAAPVHVAGAIANADGSRFTGYLTLSWQTFSAGSTFYPGRAVQMPITAGAFNATLQPGSYTLTWDAPGQARETIYLTVPPTPAGQTLQLADVVTTGPGTPAPLPVPLSAIAPSGASIGQVATWNGTQWAPAGPSGYTTTVDATSYNDGFIAAVNGSRSLTGSTTAWSSALNGSWLFTPPCREVYRVTITDPTHATLDRPYNCPSQSGRYALTQSTSIPQSAHLLGILPLHISCYTGFFLEPAENQYIASNLTPAQVRTTNSNDVELLWATETHGTCSLSR